MRQLTAITLVVLTLLACSLSATPIGTLYNTGLGSEMSPDPHWTLVGGTAYFTNSGGYPFPYWLANSSTSRWISPQPNYTSGQTDPVGTVTFQTTFDLTGFVPSTASIQFQVAADNQLNAVRINATTTGITALWYDHFSGPFTINSGFVAGINTLSFDVYNWPFPEVEGWWNPTALRVEILSAEAQLIPEPATWLLVGAGLAGCLLYRRRKV